MSFIFPQVPKREFCVWKRYMKNEKREKDRDRERSRERETE